MLPLKRATRPPSKNRAHLDTVQLVLNNRTMKIKTATTIFEVLASEVRLSIFRLLVKYAPEGLVAGEISQMLDIPKTNLSFHLKNIMYSGLVSMEREGRNTRYRANIPLMLETIAYLASNVVPAILPTASRTWRKAVSNRNFYRFIAKNKRITRR